MQLEIINSHDPVTTAAISSFEKRCGVALPQQYTRFLRAHNGGEFRGTPAYSTIDKIPGGVGGVDYFFGLTKDRRTYDDLWRQLGQGELETIDRIPNLLGVAQDACGMVYICCKGKYQGNVYIRMLDGANLYLVSNSFDAFLDSVSPDPFESTIPVFRVVEAGDIDALQGQIAAGIDIETRNAEQETLLMFACKVKSPRCVTWLLDAGAQVNAVTDQGKQAIHFATRARVLDCVRILVARGANINATTSSGESPLFISLERVCCWERLAELIVELGGDEIAADANGRSALGMACQDGYRGVCTKLIERGANVEQAIAWVVKQIVTDSDAQTWGFTGLRHLGAVDELIDLSAKGHTLAMDAVLAIAPGRADFHQALQTAMHNPDEDIRDCAKDCLEEARLSKSAGDSSL